MTDEIRRELQQLKREIWAAEKSRQRILHVSMSPLLANAFRRHRDELWLHGYVSLDYLNDTEDEFLGYGVFEGPETRVVIAAPEPMN